MVKGLMRMTIGVPDGDLVMGGSIMFSGKNAKAVSPPPIMLVPYA